MLEQKIIVFVSFGYMGLLFAIAFWGDKRAEAGKSIISNPYIYALSLAVYCTAWTFYGSVGAAGRSGATGFLNIYLGPTFMMILGWPVLRKIICISKINRITSIADFIASRYGKSATIAGAVTIIAVLGIVPYMSVQIKAISTSFQLISQYPDVYMAQSEVNLFATRDTAFFVAILLALFAVIFGTRHLDATERHEGLVAAIAFESIIKLLAVICVGLFITYGLYSGFKDLFEQASLVPGIRQLFVMQINSDTFTGWYNALFLAMMAVFLLPRQFQVIVVENVDENHLKKAVWLFPLYLLAINIFVIPIAFGGMIYFFEQCGLDPACKQSFSQPFGGILKFAGGSVDADYFALTLLMAQKQQALALFAFIGGMSAATGMVIVETIALSTMVCNDLVMPVLLRLSFLRLDQKADLSRLLLIIRRISILLIVILGYLYFHYVVQYYSLVSIGMISFAAVAQFSPAVIGGIFWKGATRRGALFGLLAGFFVWMYTLVLPSLAQAGFLSQDFLVHGPLGLKLLTPRHLFGLDADQLGFNQYTHAVFWSMSANLLLFTGVSLFSRQTAMERKQATLFVDVFKYSVESEKSSFWRATASVMDLRTLLERFLGKQRTRDALTLYARKNNINLDRELIADAGLVSHAEKLLAGAIGSASALVMVKSVVEEEPLGMNEIMHILDETQQMIIYSRKLEKATKNLEAANERLKELDRLKNEFISTVTHELRTPLTSIRSLAEIVHHTPDLDAQKHHLFVGIIIKESERLTRLINNVLDFQKIESGRIQWQMAQVDFKYVIEDSVVSTGQLIKEKNIDLTLDLPEKPFFVSGDKDRLIQVMVNLISNAVKFCDTNNGRIKIGMQKETQKNGENETRYLKIFVQDNGIGIGKDDQEIIFHEFRQVISGSRGRPAGTGIGLTISRHIIDAHKGRIWVDSKPDKGATFFFTLPLVE
ncbi:sensor histidine kinase [Desulfobacula toluolica]|uniref:histidine kinase n=1 Tax=Desulfobacula toluolica (strain DSM 7467 / Tol2) TaxID=651182 RepID=K0NCB1_DESTT|nr:sensor histidine kinase [Desulfobacula toluolica]CCK78285.1 integral membrane sensor signal transduction histidine kinase [Desulfobacula toluolica Tol2]